MDERTFSTAVADWLTATDAPLPDAEANVQAALVRVRETGRSRWRWPSWRSGSPRRGHAAPSLVPALLAALALLLVASATALLLLLGDADGPRPPAATPMAVSGPDGLHWQTERIDLRAEGLRLEAGERVFTSVGRPIELETIDTRDARLLIVANWTEDGIPISIELAMGTTVGGFVHWWAEEIRADIDGRPFRAVGPFFLSPWAVAFEGDVALTLQGDDGEATLALDGLELTMAPPVPEPWWEGAHIFGIPIPDFIGPILPEPAGEDERLAWEAARRDQTWADYPLGGTLLDGGVVWVTIDSAGNTLDDVVDVAIGRSGDTWVAGERHVFQLGVLDSRVSLDERAGTIRRIEVTEDRRREDRRLIVHADGLWELADGEWSQLSEADYAGLELVDTVPDAMEQLEGSIPAGFVVDGMQWDGTVWGHGEELDRVLLIPPVAPLAVLDPSVTVSVGDATLPGELLEGGAIRITGNGGQPLYGVMDIVVDAGGTVWFTRGDEVLALGHPEPFGASDGSEWFEDLGEASDGGILVSGSRYWRLEDGSLHPISVPPLEDGLRFSGVDLEGTFWAREGRGRVRARWDGDSWVRYGLEDIFPSLSDAEGGTLVNPNRLDGWGRLAFAPPFGLASWFDGESWHELDADAADLVGDPSVRMQTHWIGEDHALWLRAGPDDDSPTHVLRLSEGTWSTHRVEDLAGRAGIDGMLAPPSGRGGILPARDGRSIMLRLLEDGQELPIVFDGQTVTRVPPLPRGFEWLATSDDGSIWGNSPGGGLTVIPGSAASAPEPAGEDPPDEGTGAPEPEATG
jgi:hypothetical protein